MNSRNTFNLSRSRRAQGRLRLIIVLQPLNLEYSSESCFAGISNLCHFTPATPVLARRFHAFRYGLLINTFINSVNNLPFKKRMPRHTRTGVIILTAFIRVKNCTHKNFTQYTVRAFQVRPQQQIGERVRNTNLLSKKQITILMAKRSNLWPAYVEKPPLLGEC